MELGELLAEWEVRIRRAQRAHFEAATALERAHFAIGIPLVILSTVVGSSVFASLQQQTDVRITIAVGVASVLTAILAGVQTFLRFAERAERHRVVAAKFGVLRKDIEVLRVRTFDQKEREAATVELKERWNELSEGSPTVPVHVWQRTNISRQKDVNRTSTNT